MKYSKFSAYMYLIFSVVFFVMGLESFFSKERNPWFLLAFSAVALFMYFFRLKMIKKMSDKQ